MPVAPEPATALGVGLAQEAVEARGGSVGLAAHGAEPADPGHVEELREEQRLKLHRLLPERVGPVGPRGRSRRSGFAGVAGAEIGVGVMAGSGASRSTQA